MEKLSEDEDIQRKEQRYQINSLFGFSKRMSEKKGKRLISMVENEWTECERKKKKKNV